MLHLSTTACQFNIFMGGICEKPQESFDTFTFSLLFIKNFSKIVFIYYRNFKKNWTKTMLHWPSQKVKKVKLKLGQKNWTNINVNLMTCWQISSLNCNRKQNMFVQFNYQSLSVKIILNELNLVMYKPTLHFI